MTDLHGGRLEGMPKGGSIYTDDEEESWTSLTRACIKRPPTHNYTNVMGAR